jgi:hypothetical protein
MGRFKNFSISCCCAYLETHVFLEQVADERDDKQKGKSPRRAVIAN